MNIDQQIKQALQEEYQEIVEQNRQTDANPFKQMRAGFKTGMKWVYAQVIFYSVVFFGISMYGIYRFYHEQDPKSLLGWGIVVIVFTLLTQFAKSWYWSELGRNRVIREVKLLELQVAHLTEKLDQRN